MKRVGFFFRDILFKWNGGINYYRNLILILKESDKYKPVILASPVMKPVIDKLFSDVEVHYSKLLNENSILGVIRRYGLYIFKYHLYVERLIKKFNIDIISHNDIFPMVKNSKAKSLAWIPDFQSSHLPELFEDSYLRKERLFRIIMLENATKICVSSEDAKRDFIKYFSNNPVFLRKLYVFPFALPPVEKTDYDINILKKYSLAPYSYFVVSNQFWAHKNHIVVVEALKLIQKDIKIIITGNLQDLRGNNVFEKLNNYILKNDLSDKIVFTNDIAYSDVKNLQYYSMAVIQPSLFEGWNTSVEECKIIGKKIILSNINVHLEQNPENAVYFNPRDSSELASVMENVISSYSIEQEKKYEEMAKGLVIKNWCAFKEKYISILDEVLEN